MCFEPAAIHVKLKSLMAAITLSNAHAPKRIIRTRVCHGPPSRLWARGGMGMEWVARMSRGLFHDRQSFELDRDRTVTESLRDIRIFIAAYEERSFTAAAVRENATQSGVSQHIRKLEEGFRVKLFSREKGQVAPTPAADSYYARCIEVLRCVEAANAAMTGFSGVSGDVFVGLMPTMTRATLAPAIRRVIAECPNVTVHVVEAYSHLLTQKVLVGELDFAVVPAFASGPGLQAQTFLRTWETLVASPDRAWHLKKVRLQDAGPLKLVVPGKANTRRLTIETYLATHDVQVERILELDAMMGTLDVVSNSDWVTILPALMMTSEIERMHFSVSPIVGPAAPLDLVLIEPMRRPLTSAASAFLKIIRQEAERLNNLWQPHFDMAGGDSSGSRSATA